MTTSAELLNVLSLQSQLAEYTNQQIHWGRLQENMTARVKSEQKYESKWEKAFDEAQEASKDLKIKGKTFIKKDSEVSDAQAEAYAYAKVKDYDPEKLEELEDLEIEYEEMSTMYETLMEEVKGQLETDKQHLAQEAQDTKMLSQ